MKTVLITGASRGIGRACALTFAKEGYAVAVNYHHNREAAESLIAELHGLGADAALFCADMADSAEVTQMGETVLKRFGHVDVLVCNAGIAEQKLVTDITDDDWQRMMAVNVNGMFYSCRALLPHMIRRQRGKIITVSSIWGITGASCEVAYSTAKAAVIGFTKALAKEVGPSGICVNCVAPGVIDTDMNGHLDETARAELADETPLGRMGTPQEAADVIAFLASEKAAFITGQVISPNGGFII